MSFWRSWEAQSLSSNKVNKGESTLNLSLPFNNANRRHETFIYFLDVFSKSECDTIIGICNNVDKYGGLGEASIGDGQVYHKTRKSKTTFVGKDNQTDWIYNRVQHKLLEANNEFWNYSITSFGNFQFTKYSESMFYTWHQDIGPDEMVNRKLSVVVNLTDPEEYTGGELQFFGTRGLKVPNSIGSVVVFPSYEYHRVTAVKSGTRYSLVNWILGPAFQ